MKVRYDQIYRNPNKCCKFQFGFFTERFGNVDIFWCINTNEMTVSVGHMERYMYSVGELSDILTGPPVDDQAMVAYMAWNIMGCRRPEEEPKYKYKELK